MITLKRTPLLGLGLAVLAIGAFACTATVNGGSSALDGGSTNPDGGSTNPDGGVMCDPGPCVDGGGPGGATKGGVISVAQTKPTPATFATTAVASFFAATAATTGTSCKIETIGSCSVSDCDLTAAPADAGAPADSPNAGIITITGGKIPAAGIELKPDGANKTYTPVSGTTEIYGGSDLSVKAAGGDVPAFDGKTVAPPSDLTGFAPALSFVAPITIPRDADFTLNWTGGGAGNAAVSLSTYEMGVKSVTISCTVPANANTIKVQKEALAKLSTTSMTVNGIVSATPSNSAPFMAGDYAITFSASGVGGSGFFKTQ